MNPFFVTDFSISDSLKTVRKSVLIYETIILCHKKCYDVAMKELKKARFHAEKMEEVRRQKKSQFTAPLKDGNQLNPIAAVLMIKEFLYVLLKHYICYIIIL